MAGKGESRDPHHQMAHHRRLAPTRVGVYRTHTRAHESDLQVQNLRKIQELSAVTDTNKTRIVFSWVGFFNWVLHGFAFAYGMIAAVAVAFMLIDLCKFLWRNMT
jgi:hypothetical protein